MKNNIEQPRRAAPSTQAELDRASQSRPSSWRTVGAIMIGAVGGAVVVSAPPWRELVDQAASWVAAQGLPITGWTSPSPPQRSDWADLSETERRAVALSYGYDGPVRDGLFSRWLDLAPDKKADFLARYAPPLALRSADPPDLTQTTPIQSPPTQTLPVAAVHPPERGDWTRMSQAEREAAARRLGYDGPVRDGLFARWLESRPDKKAEFAARYLPAPVSSPAESSSTPSVVAPSPQRGDWASMSEAEREATARRFGYAGPVRDGLFARWLESRPDKKADFVKRYLPASPPPTAAVEPPVAAPAALAPSPPVSPPAPPPKPTPVSSSASTPAVKADSKTDPRSSKPAGAGGAPHYTVRVGSFLDHANADATAARLIRAGHQAYVYSWTDAKGRTWRVVRVGDYNNPAEAQRVVAVLERLGLSGQTMRLK